MLSNYGYEDGSGTYYISIDTDLCAECEDKACLDACPEALFVTETDDYDDEVVCVREEQRNKLRLRCALCKSGKGGEKDAAELPCLQACQKGALRHSW